MTTPAPEGYTPVPPELLAEFEKVANANPSDTDEIKYNRPQPGMALLTVGGRHIVLRRVTHGELQDFSFAAADIEDKYVDVDTTGTRAQLEVVFKMQADAYHWLVDVVERLGTTDAVLPEQRDCPVEFTGMRTLSGLLQFWMGNPPVPGA